MNIKFTRYLSISSMNEWIKELENLKKKQLPKIALKTADRLADEMLKNVVNEKGYKETTKIKATLEGNVAKAGIENKEKKAKFKEFGTGIVGSQNPHVAEALQKTGWKYDINNHGEKGWVYPVGNGEYRWTKGQPASKKFWQALEKAEELFPEIAKEEFLREVGR